MNLIKSPKYTYISKYKLSYEDFKWYLWIKKEMGTLGPSRKYFKK